jgi:kindlin 2
MHRTSADVGKTALWTVNLKGCDVTPDVMVTASRYNMKLLVPSHDGVNEIWLRADSEEQYAKWMAAFRLACKGRTMADSSFESEDQSILSLLSMQHRATPITPPTSLQSSSLLNVQPQDYVPARFLKKIRNKQLVQRILEAHGNVHALSLTEAKLTYIRAWQALPDFGFSYFITKFKGSKKEELLGVTFNRLVRLDLQSGECHKSWPLQHMKSWSVNWDIKQVLIAFEGEDLALQCLTADCKVVHEFIGGYIFMSMRSGDRSQTLNEELFHKLTGGWI